MALTIALQQKERLSTHNLVVADITFDSSYATGGEVLNPSDLGLVSVTACFCEGGAIVPQYDRVNNKLKAFWGATGLLVEVTSTTDLHLQTVRCLFYGHGN